MPSHTKSGDVVVTWHVLHKPLRYQCAPYGQDSNSLSVYFSAAQAVGLKGMAELVCQLFVCCSVHHFVPGCHRCDTWNRHS